MKLTTIVQDVKYALRMLRQSPVFTAVAVSSLALGIGATTAIFTLTDAILLRWLPVQNPQELVVLGRNPVRKTPRSATLTIDLFATKANLYAGVIAHSSGAQAVSFSAPERAGASQLIALSLVTGNYFEVLGVTPAVGRLFNAADNENEGAHPYAVLSHPFWKRAFGEDTSVVGRDIVLNGARFQVAGVSREGFSGTTVGTAPDVFVPIVMYRTFRPDGCKTLDDFDYYGGAGARDHMCQCCKSAPGTRDCATPRDSCKTRCRRRPQPLDLANADGVTAALWLTRFAETMLFGIKAQDPATFIGTGILLLGVTTVAAYLPARRATRVHPMVALRHE